MSGFGSLFKSPAKAPTMAAGINLQTSVYGKPVPIVYGTTRVSGNMLLGGNFVATGGGSGGGKGGLFGGGGAPSGYTYFAAFAFAFSEGPINGVGKIWLDRDQHVVSDFNDNLFLGTFPQTAWGTAISWNYVDQSGSTISGTVTTQLGYNGIAYIGFNSFNLGNSASIPNLQYEVQGLLSTSVTGSTTTLGDADPSLIVTDVLTNANHGMSTSFAPKIGSLTTYQNYCFAAGLFVSPNYNTQRTVTDIIDELALATNSAPVWTSGQFTLVPYGDQTLTANGKTYTPPGVQYSLTDNDFMKSPQGGGSVGGGASGPVVLERKRASDKTNVVKLEFLDRSNNYQPGIAYANDQDLIDRFGVRSNGSRQMHLFALSTAANLSAQLQLRRLARISNTYFFDLDQRYILLDPMDLVQLTDSNLGLSAQAVRITKIQENDDGTLSYEAEEYLGTTGSAPAYVFGAGSPFNQNPGSVAPSVNTPIILEPPATLLGGNQATNPQVWIAASGPNSLWGGCNVWLSVDNSHFTQVATITTPARMGTLTAAINQWQAANPDNVDTLSVDLAESLGTLTSGSALDAQLGNTLCIVDAELLSFQSAALVSGNKYNLTNLYRGLYNTANQSHLSGALFARLDDSIAKIDLTPTYVNQIIYIKLQSFNFYGKGTQSLASCTTYTFVPSGLNMLHAFANALIATNQDSGSITNPIGTRQDHGYITSQTVGGTIYYMPIAVDLGGFASSFSLNFNGTANQYMTRTCATAQNQKSATISFWIKRQSLTNGKQTIFEAKLKTGSSTAGSFTALWFSTVAGSTNKLQFAGQNGSTNWDITNNTSISDVTTWHNVTLTINLASTDSNQRLQLAVDKSTTITAVAVPSSAATFDMLANITNALFIGVPAGVVGGNQLQALFAEYYYMDGQSLTSTSFTASTVGPPVSPQTFNGVADAYLNFAVSTNLGEDFSGENNTYSLSNITSTLQTNDHP